MLAIEIIKPRSRPFLVATWYRPPNSSAIAFTAFQNAIDKIDAENSEFYLLGDINCDVSSESPDCNTINLLNICNIFNLSQIISEPTRITNTSKSLIDLCFTNFPDKVRGSGVHSLGISDHSLIYLIRKSNWQVIDANNSVAKRQFKNFNNDEFLNDLREINWSDIHSQVNPNDMWLARITKFSALLDIHAPVKNKRLRCSKSPWINSSLISKLRERDSLKKRFDKNPSDVIWSKYKKIRNEVNKLIKKTKRDYFLARINSAKSDPKKTWKLINELSSRKVHEATNVKNIKQDDTEITNSYEIANAFNTYFTMIGESLANELPHSDIDPISYLNPVNSSFSLEQLNVETVIESLKAVNSNKATGPDNIPGRVLKIAAEFLSPSLTAIFNRSLSMGIYPDDWKMARVLPIFKSGEKSDLGNYRPISIISAIAKVFGRLVYDQFYTYLTSNQLINSYQSGFRPTYSTLTSLLETTNNWCVNIDRGLLNGVVFIELRKAFDTIDHEILLSKLKAHSVDDLALVWFRSYLTDRKSMASSQIALL